MLKYVDTAVVFSEIPNEITLAINISGCPNRCPECHSKYLWEDIGQPLYANVLFDMIYNNNGITCVCFMGGDQDPKYINTLAKEIKESFSDIKTAWYSGLSKIHKDINPKNFDFIKVGPFISEKGPLTSKTTNQVFYAKGKHLKKMDVSEEELYDVTDWFWNK